MFSDRPGRGQINLGLGGPVPRDLLVLMGVLFFTFSLSAFQTTGRLMEIFRLGPELWRQGFLWQLATYPFVAPYGSGLWLVLSLWMIFMFGRSVFSFVGRRHFWRHFFFTTLLAGSAAVLTQVMMELLGAATPLGFPPLGLMSGLTVVLVFVTVGFATLYSGATIYLMFVLPVRAGWFIGLEAVFIFFAFLETRDFAGFVGLLTVLGVTYLAFSGRNVKRIFHEWRLRIERKILEAKLRRLRKRGGGSGGDGVVRGPWVN